MSAYYNDFIERYPDLKDSVTVRKAFEIAERQHSQMKRKSGEPYIIHPIAVAKVVADLGMDENTIAAALLHDVVEDTDYTLEDVEREFDREVMKLVDGVTKLSRLNRSREEQEAETVRKLLLASNSNVRVIIIKLADRLHNMNTMEYQSGPKQIEKATETLSIYVPLAQRLGMTKMARELEDLSFRYTNPKEYFAIVAKLESTQTTRNNYIENIQESVSAALEKAGIKGRVDGRLKNIYSIYRKMKEQDKDFDGLYDIVALRIIVKEVMECYLSLGTVHLNWKPIPDRFKDYIAVPKQNMYQSLHTTVLGEDGIPFEVQIRTEEMHRTAEYGIAAHWKYKEGQDTEDTLDNKLDWLRNIVEWQTELSDSREFMETLTTDITSDNVYVFTPKGDVKDFIKGSTPLDFAYSIHSDIGNRCMGARVNGKLVPLNYELKTGDIVEIIPSPSRKGPSRDWLKFVHTALARNKINLWFRKELKEENIEKGRDIIQEAAKANGYTVDELLSEEALKPLFERYSLVSVEDMLASFGYGGLPQNQIITRLLYQARINRERISEGRDVIAKDPALRDLPVRLAKCCSPIPGDDITGYLTQGRGITVHRKDCKNFRNSRDFSEDRIVEVSWAADKAQKYPVEIQITGEDRIGMLADVSKLLSQKDISINLVNARVNRDGEACFLNIKMDVISLDELNGIMSEIAGIDGVSGVSRISS